MMVTIKIVLFISIVTAVRLVFIYSFESGNVKINRMKEIIDFIGYLRIYSCDMKMSLDEIMLKYNFKSDKVKTACEVLTEEIRNKNYKEVDKEYFQGKIDASLSAPDGFDKIFEEVTNYYGDTLSDVLDKKLLYTEHELEKILNEYTVIYKEKKQLYGKLSFLLGCLMAIILL